LIEFQARKAAQAAPEQNTFSLVKEGFIMKKGLLLALLMAAVVALYAVPVYAEAPVIQSLNDVVIGDADPGDNNGTLYLMRYNNIFDLSDPTVIVWNNPTYTTDSFHVYYKDMGGDTTIAASNQDRLATSLSTADVARIDSGLAPLTAASEVTSFTASSGYSFFWLSLIDSEINAQAAVPMTNSYSATAAVNGVDRAATYGATYAAQNTVKLYAAVTSGTGKVKTDNTDFLVYVGAGATDTTSPTQVTVEDLVPKNNWTFSNTGPFAGAGFTGANSYTSTNGVGFDVSGGADSTNIMTAQWARKDATKTKSFVTPFNGGGGFTKPLVKVIGQMRATNATAATTPGYRLLGLNAAYTHMAYVLYRTAGSGGVAPNMPFSGNDRDITLMLSCPLTLTDMGDADRVAAGAWLAGSADAGTDGRDYALQVDLAVFPASGESGIITLEKLTVITSEAPSVSVASPAPIDWAGKFDTWTALGVDAPGNPAFFAGSASKTASALTLTAGAMAVAGQGKLVIAQPPLADCTGFLNKDDQLVRVQFTIASSSVNAAPNTNLYAQAMKADTSGRLPGVQWWSTVGSVLAAGARFGVSPPAVQAPTEPPTTPVALDVYLFTGKTAAADDFVYPQIQVWTSGSFGPGTGSASWPAQDGSVIVSGFTMGYMQ